MTTARSTITAMNVENVLACAKNILAAPAMPRMIFHFIVQYAAASEIGGSAHLLISNDLYSGVLIWSVLFRTL